MKFPTKVMIPMLLLILATVACSLGGNSSNPPAANNNSSSGSDQSPTQSSTSGGGSSGSCYGTVPLPTDTVDLKAGEVYKIGQAIKDPAVGSHLRGQRRSKRTAACPGWTRVRRT